MVNGINSNFYVQNVQASKPQTIQENRQQAVTNPIDNYTMAGLESLGIYNMSLIKNKKDFTRCSFTEPETSIKTSVSASSVLL